MEKTFLSLNVSPYLILGLAIPGCLFPAQDNLRLSKFHFLMPGLRCGLKGMKSTHSIRRQISFPWALARVSERANKWAQQSAWAKRAVWSKWMMEQCERMSEGPSTQRINFIYSLPHFSAPGLKGNLRWRHEQIILNGLNFSYFFVRKFRLLDNPAWWVKYWWSFEKCSTGA